MNRASKLLVVHVSARLLTFMPTFLLFYSCNLFWCDTKFVLNVQPPTEENSKPFLYSVGRSLYLHWWRTLMPTGCSLHGPPTGRRNNGPSKGRRNSAPSAWCR